MTDLAQLYQRSILEHHRQPKNAGRLPAPTHLAEGHNPLCGDRLTMTLEVSAPELGVERVLRACCDAQGCAICRASGSMLTEAVVGLSVAEVSSLIERFMAEVSLGQGAEPSGEGLGPLAALFHVRHFPNRLRCATLSWDVLRRAVVSRVSR